MRVSPTITIGYLAVLDVATTGSADEPTPTGEDRAY